MHKILHELILTYKITKVETLYLQDVDQGETILGPRDKQSHTSPRIFFFFYEHQKHEITLKNAKNHSNRG